MVIRCNLFLLFHNWAVWVEFSSDSSYQILGMIFGFRTHLKVGIAVVDRRDHGLVFWLEPTWGWVSACGFLVSSQLVLWGATASVPQRTRWRLDLQWLSICSHSTTSAMRVRPVKCEVGTRNLVSFSADRQHQVVQRARESPQQPSWEVRSAAQRLAGGRSLETSVWQFAFSRLLVKKNMPWLCSWYYFWTYSFEIYCDILFAF